MRTDLPAADRAMWAAAFRAAVPAGTAPRTVLDLGCGTGRFTALLAATFDADVVGLDASVAMLREGAMAQGARVRVAAAQAPALPVRDGAVDVALLSMVYHLLAPAAATVAALHRIVRPGGYVLVRTPTLELLDRISWLPFFPEARAIDDARMPSRSSVRETFGAAGFTTRGWRTLEQEFAPTPAEALAKVRRRPFSTLRQLSDSAFEEGLARFAAHCATASPTRLVEVLDFFVFERPDRGASSGQR